MHRNSNITGNPISNFHNAGIFDFVHLQHVDFQCLFSYKNALTFTGKEKDSETGFYYFGARYYDPSLSGLFLSVDPMADKYPSLSPYAYCAWNPVKLVDPDGRDVWELNKSGELIWKESSDTDIIMAKNGKSVIVKDGVLQRGDSYKKENNKFMCLNFGDDMKNATEVFEFFADNTDNIEFSFLGVASSIESEESSTFIVGTSYEEKGDHYSSKGAERFAEQGLLRQYNHNHPNGDMRPSNILNNGFFYKANTPGDDSRTATGIDIRLENANCRYKCSFAIYVNRKNGLYKPYHTKNDKVYGSSVNKNDKYYKYE